MVRKTGLLSLSLMGLLAVGCVPNEKFQALKMEARLNEEAAVKARQDAAAAQARANALQAQLDAVAGNPDAMAGIIKGLNDELAARNAENADLRSKYDALMANAGKMNALPVALTNELSQFAAQNPDLVEFDQAKGTVKFKSDVTFATGDAEVTPAAKTAIARFAEILNSPAAANYELLIAGHTDNAPVRNPNTIQKGHKDNWYLSSHRAISVASTLVSDKVRPERLGVLGYADQRPVASNGSDAGRAQNRRVEVLILPTQARPGAPAAAPATPGTPANKDAGATIPPAPQPAVPEQNK